MKLPTDRAKIRVGQVWKKKQTAMVIKIAATHGSDKFSFRVLGDNRKSSGHRIMANDLYRFWKQL